MKTSRFFSILAILFSGILLFSSCTKKLVSTPALAPLLPSPEQVRATFATFASGYALKADQTGLQVDYDGMDAEVYNRIDENPFLEVLKNPLSTFSVDVDTASYSNIRRMLSKGGHAPERRGEDRGADQLFHL